jgi:hypothetical protein
MVECWRFSAFQYVVKRIRSFATLNDATIIFGHDLSQIKEIRLAPEAYYD